MAQNPIPDDWDAASWCNFSVCWPDSVLWRGLLVGLLTSPGRGRFWDAKTGTITDAQLVGREILDVNTFLTEVCMSCTGADDVVEAINAAIAGIASGGGGCGCGSGGAGGTETPGSTETPGLPGDREGDPPTGFSTWDEYEEYKCDIATAIVERVGTDLAWMELVDIVTLTATALAFSLLTPVPFDDVVAVLGFVVALSLQGVFIDAIQDMQAAVAADFDDFVCALYEAGAITGAKEDWDDQVDTSIDGQTAAIYAPIEKAALQAMMTNDALNSLFDRDTALEAIAPIGDCSGCEIGCPAYTVTRGTEDSPGNYSSEDTGEGLNHHRISIANGCRSDVDDCGPALDTTIVTTVGFTAGASTNGCRISSDECEAANNPDLVEIPHPSPIYGNVYCAKGLHLASTTAFTAEITLGDECI